MSGKIFSFVGRLHNLSDKIGGSLDVIVVDEEVIHQTGGKGRDQLYRGG